MTPRELLTLVCTLDPRPADGPDAWAAFGGSKRHEIAGAAEMPWGRLVAPLIKLQARGLVATVQGHPFGPNHWAITKRGRVYLGLPATMETDTK